MALDYNCSLDTNAILRIALNDVPKQAKKVNALLSDETQNFYVCDLVIAEVIFNLKNQALSRSEISSFLKFFFSLPNVHPESSFVLDILDFYVEHPSLSFVDCYSAAFAEVNKKEPLLTFDKKLAKKHPSAKLIE